MPLPPRRRPTSDEISAEARALIADLAAVQTDDERDEMLGALGELAARYARARRLGPKSYAGWIRQNVPADFRPAVLRAARDAYRRRVPVDAADDRWADVEEIADMLDIEMRDVESMLCTVDGRRGLWWPTYLGRGRWRWPRDVLLNDEARRIRSAGDEPPHPVPLPDECDR